MGHFGEVAGTPQFAYTESTQVGLRFNLKILWGFLGTKKISDLTLNLFGEFLGPVGLKGEAHDLSRGFGIFVGCKLGLALLCTFCAWQGLELGNNYCH
jgi:hypothetical protein